LAATSRWLGRALESSQGLNGGIKADGSILHHGNHYPAYAEGGIRGATQALWLFGNTALRVPEPGHANLRQAMLNLRFHSNVLQWPLSLSGRHPNGEFSLSPDPYLFLALSGTPNGREALDREVAAVWQRLDDAAQRSSTPGKKFRLLSAFTVAPCPMPKARKMT
jgi:chondroitin-sulfate-ABC endolyase/exolyase